MTSVHMLDEATRIADESKMRIFQYQNNVYWMDFVLIGESRYQQTLAVLVSMPVI